MNSFSWKKWWAKVGKGALVGGISSATVALIDGHKPGDALLIGLGTVAGGIVEGGRNKIKHRKK